MDPDVGVYQLMCDIKLILKTAATDGHRCVISMYVSVYQFTCIYIVIYGTNNFMLKLVVNFDWYPFSPLRL